MSRTQGSGIRAQLRAARRRRAKRGAAAGEQEHNTVCSVGRQERERRLQPRLRASKAREQRVEGVCRAWRLAAISRPRLGGAAFERKEGTGEAQAGCASRGAVFFVYV
ncbi:hypothetical protein TRVL_06804 [Trypanosoma vivax]|nr:hypothetical protein TRVL_06804 [Trypanosoma vivax]